MRHHILRVEKNCGKDLNIIKYFHIVGVYYNVYSLNKEFNSLYG